MTNIIEKFRKIMNTKVSYKFGLLCGILICYGSILAIGFSIFAKFFYTIYMQDYYWKLSEMIFYLVIGIWFIIIYIQPDYVEEEIKVYDVPNKFGGNK